MTEMVNLKELMKKELRSILLSSSRSLSSFEIERDYVRMIGRPVPVRPLGYASIEDLLTDLPDVVTCRREYGQLMFRAIANKSTLHMAELISKNIPRVKALLIPYRRPSPAYPNSFGQTLGSVNLSSAEPYQILRCQIIELLTAYPKGLPLDQFEFEFTKKFCRRIAPADYGFESTMDMMRSMSDIADIEGPLPGVGYLVAIKNRVAHCDTDGLGMEKQSTAVGLVGDVVNPSSSVIDIQIRKDVRMVLEQAPDGIPAAKFSTEFKNVTGVELPWKELGFRTVIDFMVEMEDIVSRERPTAGDWILFDARLDRTAVMKSRLNRTDGTDHLSNIVKWEGSEDPALSYLTDNFNSHAAVNRSGKPSTGDWTPWPNDHETQPGQKRARSPLNDLPTEMEGWTFHIPKDFVGSYVSYPRHELPPVSLVDYLAVRVCCALNPGRFWIQLHRNAATFDQLVRQLQIVYNNQQSNKFVLPPENFEVGQVCVARSPDTAQWCRGRIDCINNDLALVNYVDYGRASYNHASSIRCLMNNFFTMPAQAIPACLAYIQPADKNWTPRASYSFKMLTGDRVLVARVTNVNEKNGLSLLLCDTTGDVDVHVNDTLISDSHGVIRADG